MTLSTGQVRRAVNTLVYCACQRPNVDTIPFFLGTIPFYQVKMDAKYELLDGPPKHSKNSVAFARLRQVAGALTFVLVLLGAFKLHGFQTLRSTWSSPVAACSAGTSSVGSNEYIPRDIYYNLTISQAWRNPGECPVIIDVYRKS